MLSGFPESYIYGVGYRETSNFVMCCELILDYYLTSVYAVYLRTSMHYNDCGGNFICFVILNIYIT
jgi:hypothetical protein